MIESGQLYLKNLKDIQICLLKKEIKQILYMNNVKVYEVSKIQGPE